MSSHAENLAALPGELQNQNGADAPRQTTEKLDISFGAAPVSPQFLHDPSEKRHSGRTGPTSSEGKAISSQNATKHGACSQTLILPGESEEEWFLLLARWRETYQPAENLEFDFVLKAAQAEWYRLRAQRNYDELLASVGAAPPHTWESSDIKCHDLSLRYKTAAERSFQREYRLLEQHFKTHRPKAFRGPHQPEPLIQKITVSIVAGKPRIYTAIDKGMIRQWSNVAAAGAKIQRIFSFPDGVPSQFAWMFPDPAARVPGAIFKNEMSLSNWSSHDIAGSFLPEGVPVDYAAPDFHKEP